MSLCYRGCSTWHSRYGLMATLTTPLLRRCCCLSRCTALQLASHLSTVALLHVPSTTLLVTLGTTLPASTLVCYSCPSPLPSGCNPQVAHLPTSLRYVYHVLALNRAAVVTTALLPSGCSSLFSPTLAEARAPLTRPPHRSYGAPTLSARLTCVSSPTRSCHLLPAPCLLGTLASLTISLHSVPCFPRHSVPPTRSGTSLPSCRW